MWGWLIHVSGIDNESGRFYAFWSGLGSDLGELAIIGALFGAYRKHNCHVHRCWRLSRHPVDGTPFLVCRKHHPTIDAAPTAEQVRNAHEQAQA